MDRTIEEGTVRSSMLDALALFLMTIAAMPALYFVYSTKVEEARSTPPVATLFPQGEVTSRRAGSLEWIDAPRHYELYIRDTVATGKNGSAHLIFRNSDTLDLSPNSLIQIQEAGYDSYDFVLAKGSVGIHKKDKKVTLEGKGARIRIDSGKIAVEKSKEDVAIHAPRAATVFSPSIMAAVVSLNAVSPSAMPEQKEEDEEKPKKKVPITFPGLPKALAPANLSNPLPLKLSMDPKIVSSEVKKEERSKTISPPKDLAEKKEVPKPNKSEVTKKIVKVPDKNQKNINRSLAAEKSKGLTREEVGRVIQKHKNEIDTCYHATAIPKERRTGKLVVTFTVGLEGRITHYEAISHGWNDLLDNCVLNKLSEWKFPAPKDRHPVQITYQPEGPKD